MTRITVFLAAILWPVGVAADEVYLRGGGLLKGNVIEQTPLRVTVEIGAGQVSLPASRVERVVRNRSALDAFQERASRLSAGDRAGWLDLALWARDLGLATQARRAFERVLELDPANAAAQRALGNVLVGDRWVSSEEAYRLRGYVIFEGSWMTPAERDQRLAERRAAMELERLRAETEAGVAEAEARAAEARARAAEARSAERGLAVGYGRPGLAWLGYGRHRHRRHDGRSDGDDPSPDRVGPAPTPPPQGAWSRPGSAPKTRQTAAGAPPPALSRNAAVAGKPVRPAQAHQAPQAHRRR